MREKQLGGSKTKSAVSVFILHGFLVPDNGEYSTACLLTAQN